MKISLKLLDRLGACGDALEWFSDRFQDGEVDMTDEVFDRLMGEETDSIPLAKWSAWLAGRVMGTETASVKNAEWKSGASKTAVFVAERDVELAELEVELVTREYREVAQNATSVSEVMKVAVLVARLAVANATLATSYLARSTARDELEEAQSVEERLRSALPNASEVRRILCAGSGGRIRE